MQEFKDVKGVGIRIDWQGQRVWVCVDGACVLRVRGISETLEVTDDRTDPPLSDTETDARWPNGKGA